jgi:hypothetical protein
VSGRGQARWWNSPHRCRVTISAFAKAPAVSSQRDDKSLARGERKRTPGTFMHMQSIL